jgi:hypothetical protein
MDRGLEGKADECCFCVSYIKILKKSINWIASKPGETTHI